MRFAKKLSMAGAALAVVFAAAACDIDQTEEGELPEVSIEGGNMPEYDVDVADVDVGTTQDTLIIERPTVDVDMPDDEDDGNRRRGDG